MRDAFVKMLHLFRPADRTAADAYHSRNGSSPDRARSRRSHSRESIAGLAGAPALLRDGRRHDPAASRAVWLPFRQPQPVSFSFWPSCLSSPSEGSKTAANLGSRRGGGGVMGKGAKRSYSASPADYRLLEEVGYGASATVYRAIYVPFNEIVAVKCLDLDRCNGNLDDIRREAQTMSLIDHPNVVRAFCSFVVDHCLWVVMPFMAEGSCMHLMKAAYPDGFEESVIGSMLKETLKALEYLHRHGHIHRDVKAGNILLDNSGGVKLGDFGVSACMFDKGDRQRSRNTFVGTPCWMAPEVLQHGSGYDFKADIWSFGITALELAHGHAPFSKYPPMKVLLMTLQNAPPGLDYERDRRFSKAFKEMVAMCLVKDQTKRPTAEKLLKHSFFKQAKPPELSVKNILAGLPPLWDRVKTLQLQDAAQLALKKMPSAEQEALSQSEYQRGVSAWNFDIEDLKAQASLIQDDEDLPGRKEDNGGPSLLIDDKRPSGSRVDLEKSVSSDGCDYRKDNCVADELDSGHSNRKGEILESELLDSSNQEKDDGKENRLKHDLSPSQRNMEHNSWKNELARRQQTYSGPILSATALNNSLSGKGHNCGSESPLATEKQKREVRKAPNFTGPLLLPNRASTNSLSAPVRSTGYADSSEDKLRSSVVQIKGRFSVTSEHVDPVKGTSLRKSASVGDWFVNSKQVPSSQPSKEVNNNQLPASVLMPQLQNLVQQTSFQQDLIRHLLESLQQNELVDALQPGMPSQVLQSDNASVLETATSERERLLLVKIAELQIRMNSLTDELIAAKAQHIKLQQQLNAVCGQEEERIKEVGA